MSSRGDALGWMCPVCGYDGVDDPPWEEGDASDEICSSCGIQFGYDDAAGGDQELREQIWAEWRDRWVATGCKWSSAQPPAPGWDPSKQLANVKLRSESPSQTLSLCPVCGFDGFDEPTWTPTGGSQEICPSCGIQFGYTDHAGGDHSKRKVLWAEWRERWIANGCPWLNNGWPPPEDWDPQRQLQNLEGIDN